MRLCRDRLSLSQTFLSQIVKSLKFSKMNSHFHLQLLLVLIRLNKILRILFFMKASDIVCLRAFMHFHCTGSVSLVYLKRQSFNDSRYSTQFEIKIF